MGNETNVDFLKGIFWIPPEKEEEKTNDEKSFDFLAEMLRKIKVINKDQ